VKRNKIALALLLLSFEAWGDEYWVDLSGEGTGDANGASVSHLAAGLGDTDVAEGPGDTVYLCNETTSQLAINTLTPNGSDGSPIVYDWTCPGGTPGRVTVSGSTSAITLGAKTYQTHIGLNVSQTGTAQCINATAISNIILQGGGTVTGGGTPNATWANDDENGVIGPCGAVGFGVGNSAANNITITGMHFKDNGSGSSMLGITPTSAIALSNFTITHSYFENCGADCIRFQTTGGASITNMTVEDVLCNVSQQGCVNYGGRVQAYVPDLVNPVGRRISAIKPGQDIVNLPNRGLINLANGQNAVFEDLYVRESRATGQGIVVTYSAGTQINDMVCEDADSNWIGSYDNMCLDYDRGNVSGKAQRIFDINNPGHPDASACTGAINCSGISFSIYDTTDIEMSVLISVNARNCLMFVATTFPTITAARNTVSNMVCHAPSNNGVVVHNSTPPSADAYRVVNSVFNRVGEYAFENNSSVPLTANANNYYFDSGLGNVSGDSIDAGEIEGTAEPQFLGGPNPTTAEGFRPKASSPLCKAGTSVGPGLYYGQFGIRFGVKPDIGAMACENLLEEP
jgi:hypothetical protein